MLAVPSQTKIPNPAIPQRFPQRQHLEISNRSMPYNLHNSVSGPQERVAASGVVEEYLGQMQRGDE